MFLYFGGSIRKRRAHVDSEQHNLHSGNMSDPVDTLSKMQDQKGEPHHRHCCLINFIYIPHSQTVSELISDKTYNIETEFGIGKRLIFPYSGGRISTGWNSIIL